MFEDLLIYAPNYSFYSIPVDELKDYGIVYAPPGNKPFFPNIIDLIKSHGITTIETASNPDTKTIYSFILPGITDWNEITFIVHGICDNSKLLLFTDKYNFSGGPIFDESASLYNPINEENCVYPD